MNCVILHHETATTPERLKHKKMEKVTEMKAKCEYATGNSFDNQEGDIVEIASLFVTRVTRDGKDLDLAHPTKIGGYLMPQEKIHELIQTGDYIQENFGHGVYKVIP
jgi:carbamate kinase